MSGLFSLSLGSDAEKTIAHLAEMTRTMPRYAEFAAETVGKIIVTMIPSETSWRNPTPRLDTSFTVSPRPGGAEAGSDLPYSRRREFGFSGKTDSAGRTYINDPGAFYLKKTLQDAPAQANQALASVAKFMGI